MEETTPEVSKNKNLLATWFLSGFLIFFAIPTFSFVILPFGLASCLHRIWFLLYGKIRRAPLNRELHRIEEEDSGCDDNGNVRKNEEIVEKPPNVGEIVEKFERITENLKEGENLEKSGNSGNSEEENVEKPEIVENPANSKGVEILEKSGNPGSSDEEMAEKSEIAENSENSDKENMENSGNPIISEDSKTKKSAYITKTVRSLDFSEDPARKILDYLKKSGKSIILATLGDVSTHTNHPSTTENTAKIAHRKKKLKMMNIPEITTENLSEILKNASENPGTTGIWLNIARCSMDSEEILKNDGFVVDNKRIATEYHRNQEDFIKHLRNLKEEFIVFRPEGKMLWFNCKI